MPVSSKKPAAPESKTAPLGVFKGVFRRQSQNPLQGLVHGWEDPDD